MALSKKTRIAMAICINVVFFFVEIIVGYTAHSLALVADAFHMLNDIISLCVGYWAADVAENKSSSDGYTYGWARAEILGGLINGIFLIALCTTIILDAIQRFFEIEEVKNPKLVLIVGGVGLAFNIFGLFLFHQHDHGDHSHGEDEEEGHSHSHNHDEHAHAEHGHGDDLHSAEEESISHGNGKADHSDHAKKQGLVKSEKREEITGSHLHSSKDSTSGHKRAHSRSYSTIQDLPIHPAALRHDMRVKARFGDTDSAEYDTEDDNALADDAQQISETSPLLKKAKETATARRSKSISHHDHNHATKPKAASSGHDHDDNLRGMFLHVLGDALGNVGVMASAIIIWKWDNPYRFYFDPAISLFITLIILKSAIPLVRDTAKPLLQATPEHVNVQDIREDIESLPGIVSCHHVHVWALTRSKLVATMDVQLDFDFEQAGEQGQRRWMELARAIKACLRGWQIYSSTVQPEWCINEQHGHGGEGKDDNGEGSSESSGSSSKVTVVPSDGGRGHAPCEHGECLLADDGGAGMQCCVPAAGSSGATTPSKKGKGSGGHDHGHDDEHGHGHGHSH